MNKRILLACVALLLPGLFQASAQFRDQGMGGGIGFGATLGKTELRDKETRFLTRAFLRYPLVSHVYGEVSAGFGHVAGTNGLDASPYTTLIVPLDYRFVVSPLSFENFAAFLFAGAGALYYEVKDVPSLAGVPGGTYPAKNTGWTMEVPGGVGLLFRMSDAVAFEMNGAYHYTLKQELNGVKNGKKDGFLTFTLGLTYAGESGTADPDGDGLSNNEEKALGTDPKVPDSDGDGLSDGDETKKYNTHPLRADSDGDGLSDRDEIMTNKTDPGKADSDGDTLSDGDEVLRTKTDPLRTDSDGDGLSDGEETARYKSDPLKADTDGDGLSDGDEAAKFRTDLLKADTDGGSVNDGVEVARGTDPARPDDDVAPRREELKVEVGKAVRLEGIVFKSGSSAIQPASEPILEKAYNTLAQNPDITVEIQGHTDNTGSKARNTTLSRARANAVKAWLVEKGVDPARITTQGFGPGKPVAPNTTAEGREKNRRIEFFRVK